MSSSDTTSEYRAPFIRLPEGQTTNRGELIYFRKGHTLVKHLEWLGETPNKSHGRYQSYILQRHLDEEDLDRTRRDPGVEKVVEVTREMEIALRKEDRTVVTFVGSRPAPGYTIIFTSDSHTLEEHFAAIGETIDNISEEREAGGYYLQGPPPQSTLDKILTDPNVYIIEQNVYVKVMDPPPAIYKAPYHTLLPVDQKHNRRGDLIYFFEGYTLEKHFEAIGERSKHGQYQSFIFQRSMDDEQLDRARRDRGVEKIVQVTREMEKAAKKKDRTVAKTLGFDPAPGYFVAFTDGSYTLAEHFARIGETLENVTEYPESGYYVDVPESKLETIFADPNVCIIQQNTFAKIPEDSLLR